MGANANLNESDGDDAPLSIESLVDAAFASIRASGELTDERLEELQYLLNGLLLRAVEIVEAGLVSCIVARPSGRVAYEVEGSALLPYLVLGHRYCSCPAFFSTCVLKGEAPYCKHQVAARLADALQCANVREMSDSEWAEHISPWNTS